MPRRYTLDDVRTMADLCRALGLVPRGGNYESVRNAARRADIQLDDHLERPRRQRWDDIPDESLVAALRFAPTIADAMRAFGREPNTDGYRHVRRVAERHDVDLSHLNGRAWARNESRPSRGRPIGELLVAGRSTKSGNLRNRLIKEGLLEPRCSRCGRDTWQGGPIPLELDHIDGDRTKQPARQPPSTLSELSRPHPDVPRTEHREPGRDDPPAWWNWQTQRA